MLQLKRQHSADPDSISQPRKSPSTTPAAGDETPTDNSQGTKLLPDSVANLMSRAFTEEPTVGSPLKKQRASVDGAAVQDRSTNFPSALGDVLARASADAQAKQQNHTPASTIEEDEVL